MTANKWASEEAQQWIHQNDPKPEKTIVIEVRVNRVGAPWLTQAYMRDPTGTVSVDGVFHGSYADRGIPTYMGEAAIVHALELVMDYPREKPTPLYRGSTIEIQAGGSVSCGRWSSWFAEGDWRLASAAASRLAELSYAVARALPCPLCLFCVRRDGPLGGPPPTEMDTSWAALAWTKERASHRQKSGFSQQWEERLPRIPLTTDDVSEKYQSTI